uniref:Immunoglobulin C1-set domain-containing protein n=1 Tax=Hucho hucho TaxID=62062 RepID=A0A4W5K0K1_9TELE
MCSAFDFYPKPIRVTWWRDELGDGDWYYQIHSHLDYTPKSEEKISCMLKHRSLTQPKMHHWGKGLGWGNKRYEWGRTWDESVSGVRV